MRAPKKHGHLKEIFFDGLRTNENVLAELLSDKNAIMLKYIDDNEAIIGCVYLQKQESQIYLGLLSVLPDIQASGVGKQLLFAAEEYAQEQNCNKIVMTVITIRHELVEWYKRRGYQTTGVKPFPQDKVNIPINNWNYLYWSKNLNDCLYCSTLSPLAILKFANG